MPVTSSAPDRAEDTPTADPNNQQCTAMVVNGWGSDMEWQCERFAGHGGDGTYNDGHMRTGHFAPEGSPLVPTAVTAQ
jgi:hypothetical protein